VGAGVEIEDAVRSGGVAVTVELIARVQLEGVAAGDGSECVGKGNAPGWCTVAGQASDVGSQINKASKRPTGEGKTGTLGIDGKHGKGCGTRFGCHSDCNRVGSAGSIGGIASIVCGDVVRPSAGQLAGGGNDSTRATQGEEVQCSLHVEDRPSSRKQGDVARWISGSTGGRD
jgi:hypothetical protein